MEKTRKKVICAIFSIFLSFAGLFTILLFKPSLSKDVAKGLGITIFSLKNLVIFVVLNVFFNILLRYIDKFIYKIRIYEASNVESHKWFFGKTFIIILLFWGIWFELYYPGAGMNDTIANIMTFHNGIQPLIYQLIIYYGINGLTNLTQNMTIAYAILTAAQMVIMSLIISWIASWLKKKGISNILLNLFVAYYALMPTVADYSITLVKDTLFGIFMMALIPLIYELVDRDGYPIKNKRFYCAFIADLIGINVLRSNGKYIVIIMLFFLLLMKLCHKNYVLSVFIAMIVVNTGLNMSEKIFVDGDYTFQESIGVPMAQIGAVLTEDGYISDQNKEVLNNLLPLDKWKECYRFSFSDPIKIAPEFDNEWLNNHKIEFIKTWFSVLKENLGIYVKAYLCHTYGFWNISPLNISSIDYSQSYFIKINNNTGDDSYCGQFCLIHGLNNREIRPGTVREQINTILHASFLISLVLGAGIIFWICMGFVVELVIYRKYKACYVFVPLMINWATMMIASPASFIYRYSFYLVLSMPVLFLITLMQIKRDDAEK